MKLRSREYESDRSTRSAKSLTSTAATPSLPPPLTEFHLFPKLPTEIRDAIWKLSLPQRIVELRRNRTQTETDEPIDPFYSTAEQPLALSLCKDSRRSVLPFYPFSFGTRIRFNFSLDTIYLDSEIDDSIFNFFDSLGTNEINQLTRIAVSEEVGFVFSPVESFWPEFLERLNTLPNLTEILLVLAIQYVCIFIYDEEFAPDPTQSYAIEFFDEFPDELMRRQDLRIFRGRFFMSFWKADWKDPRIKTVYGFRRERSVLAVEAMVE